MEPWTCPECRHSLDVPERYLGKRWRCPDCRSGVFVHEDGRILRLGALADPHARSSPEAPRRPLGRALDAVRRLLGMA